MTGDVFEKNPLWAAFVDDTGDVWPEVPRVVGATSFARGTERLAGVTGKDDVEGTAEGSGIKAAQIVPDRGRVEIPCALGGDEDSARPFLPLDEGAGVETGFGKHDAQIKASATCAEGQSMPGT